MICVDGTIPDDVVCEASIEGVPGGRFTDVERLEPMVLGFFHEERNDVGSGLA